MAGFHERQRGRTRDDEMVEHADVHQGQRIRQPPGECAVGLAGFGHSARVVMRKYQRGGIVRQCALDDFTRVDAGLG